MKHIFRALTIATSFGILSKSKALLISDSMDRSPNYLGALAGFMIPNRF